MEIFDQYRRNREKKTENEQTTPPPQGHVLAEILNDKNKSHLFLKLLEQLNEEELTQRLIKGELEKDDIHRLEEIRLVFSEKITKSEKVEKMLTKENVIDFARNQPEFEKIINIVGPEKAIRVIKSQLKEVSITDEDRFNNIANSMEAYSGYKTEKNEKMNERIEELCKDGKFTPQEYLDALDIEDPEEKEEALRQLSKQKYTKFRRAIDYFTSGLGKKILEKMKDSEILLNDSYDELNTHHSNVGAMLFLSVSDNDQMRNALFGELINEKAPEEPTTGFRDAKKEASETFNEAEYNKNWEDYKIKAGYDTYPDDREVIKDMFIEEQRDLYRERNKGKKGFWVSIFEAIFEAMITNKKSTLK